MTKLSKYEKETIINWNEAEDTASIYTFNADLKRRLAEFSRKYPKLCRLERSTTEGSVTYVMDKSRLSIPWFQSHGQWGGRDYANIAPGDAIFFDWDLDGSADHVGLVVGTDGSRVYTVEGNSGDACKIKSYPLTYECIKGYGLMNW